ncbi:MAG: GGDEF domain-containing protein [Deltaproteobacteria bacterium]|nr:GGDEF domain-containing protein [Deltaproteobacteria bacterium]
MRLSIKIPVLVFLGCLAAGALGSVFLAAGLASEVRQSFESRCAGLVRSLGALGASMLSAQPPDHATLQQALDNLAEFGHGEAHGIEWLAFVDCAGRVQAHSDPRRFATQLHELPPEWLRCDGDAAAGPGTREAGLTGMAYSGTHLLVAAPVRLETRSGTAAASFRLDEVGVHEAAGRQRVFLFVAGFAAVLAVVLSLLLRTAVARRLSRLTEDTEALRRGELERRSRVHGGDEVGRLAEAFNAMADRLSGHAQYLEQEVKLRTRELEGANRELQRLATTDPLTGLLNRRRMNEVLEQALDHHRRKQRQLSIVLIDLDHFKRFNDTHGHLAGDELLRILGLRLRTRSRVGDAAARLGAEAPTPRSGSFPRAQLDSSPDGVVEDEDAAAARYGGEEFVLILPETSKADALRVAERVRAAVARAPLVETLGDAGRVTLSAGIATFPEDGADQDALLRAADEALYAAKHAGRDRILAAPARPPAHARLSTMPPTETPTGGGT